MKAVLLLACLVVAVAAAPNEWEKYKATHNKVYSAIEDKRRMKIYFENKKYVEAHNKLYEQGLSTFKMGMNKFADWTNDEFRQKMLPKRGELHKKFLSSEGKQKFVKPVGFTAPDSVDWRPLGYVTEVKDQGQCGSCWAFSTTGNIEGAHFGITGELISLSEQNLMDCSFSYGNAGCNGGFQEYAFQYVIENQGIDTEESYPYQERDGLCRYDPAFNVASVTGYTSILPRGDEDVQKDAVASQGPVAVSMQAGNPSFQLYQSGIYYDPLCQNGFFDLDHGVLAVGYGTTSDGQDYWIVKNSWGSSWGEEGYFNMARNRDNNCGIATDSMYGTGAS